MLLLIDNFDSFTYILVQYFQSLGQKVKVIKNNELFPTNCRPSKLVISPGPGTPQSSGRSIEFIEKFEGKIPILGVCLGHQCIASYFGGNIIKAKQPMHGKTSYITHTNEGVFQNLKNPFKATRYHSLVIDKKSLPSCLKITAFSESGEIMGICHKTKPIEGVQFHPESILTEEGRTLLNNFLEK